MLHSRRWLEACGEKRLTIFIVVPVVPKSQSYDPIALLELHSCP